MQNGKIIFVLLTLAAPFAGAEIFEGGAISAGTAGAGRASPEPSESVYLNPAGLGFLRGYYFSSSFGAESQTEGISLSITDAMKDTILPTAIGYQRFSTHLSSTNTNTLSQDLRLSSADKFVTNNWAVGASVHQRSDELTTTGYSQINGVLAVTGYLSEAWMLAATWEDFVKESQKIPEEIRLQSRETLAVSYLYKSTLRVKADYLTGYGDVYSKPSLVGGVENFWNKFIGFRLGVGRNYQLQQNIYSLGLSFKGPKFGLQYAYIQGEDLQNEARHVIDLTLPLW